MTKSQALMLVGILEAAFPAGTHGDVTTQLYAAQFERYPFDAANDAVQRLIDERDSSFLPPWAEVRDAIRHYLPPKPRELEQATVPPPADFIEAKERLAERIGERAQDELDHLRHRVRLRYVRDKQAGRVTT